MFWTFLTDQVEDQRELRRAARLQWQGWFTGQLLFCQRRDVFDEEIPTEQKQINIQPNNKTLGTFLPEI